MINKVVDGINLLTSEGQVSLSRDVFNWIELDDQNAAYFILNLFRKDIKSGLPGEMEHDKQKDSFWFRPEPLVQEPYRRPERGPPPVMAV